MAISSAGLLGKAETEFSAAAGTTDRLASDKGTFLKLLIAQLTHQDPLNPTEDKEFIAQLAQFTSLEQLQGINEGVTTLNTSMQTGQMVNATSFIGKDVLANGDQITKIGDGYGQVVTTELRFSIDSNISKGQINIFDSVGNLVFTDTLGSYNAGEYGYQWHGYNSLGKETPNGTYTAVVSAQDSDDKAVMVTTQFVGRVIGVENKDGVFSLVLAGGRRVKFTDVVEVQNPVTVTSNEQQPEAEQPPAGNDQPPAGGNEDPDD